MAWVSFPMAKILQTPKDCFINFDQAKNRQNQTKKLPTTKIKTHTLFCLTVVQIVLTTLVI